MNKVRPLHSQLGRIFLDMLDGETSRFWLWLAVRYGWRGVEWGARWVRERWVAWLAKGKIGTPEFPTKRTSRRQGA